MLSLTTPSKRNSKTDHSTSRRDGKRRRLGKLPAFIFNTIFRKRNSKVEIPTTDEMNIFGGYVEHRYTNTNASGHASKFSKLNITASKISVDWGSDSDLLAPMSIMDEDVDFTPPRVELPVDIWMLIVEEVTSPFVLANLARTSKLLWALSTPHLYKSIGIGLYESGIGIFPIRPGANRSCTGHPQGCSTAQDTYEYVPRLVEEAVLQGLTRRNGNGQFVKNLNFKDKRLTSDPRPIYKLLPGAVKAMRRLECFRWISDLTPRAGGKPIYLPKHLPQVLMGLQHYSPVVQEWHVECSMQIGSPRDPHRQSMIWFLDGLKVVDIQSAKDVVVLQRISNFLHSDGGRNVEDLTVGPASTFQHNQRKAALNNTFNVFAVGGEPRKLKLRKLDLRGYSYSASAPKSLDLICRETLGELRIGGNTGGNSEHVLNSEFTDEENGIPHNLRTLHLTAGYPQRSEPFFRGCPALEEFVICINAKAEVTSGFPVRNFLLQKAHKLERLAIQFERDDEGETPAPAFVQEAFSEEEDAFLVAIAQVCTQLKELSVCTSRNYVSTEFGRIAELVALFPALKSVNIGTRGDRNEWSDATTTGGPNEEWCLNLGRVAMDAYYRRNNGRFPRLLKVNDNVFRVVMKDYLLRVGDVREKFAAFSEFLRFMPTERWDMHETEIPRMFLILEMDGEMCKWGMCCNEDVDCY